MAVDETSLERIRKATFPPSRRGYDKREVDKFLNRLADWLETGGGDQARSDTVRRAFDIKQESEQTRDRYGRNVHGQSALLARRLVESGVRFVSVHDRVRNGPNNWDTHDNNFTRLKLSLIHI